MKREAERIATAEQLTKKKLKKSIMQVYMTSLLSLVLCVAMFFGTTMAWFTSEVQSSGHEIYVGSLGADLLLKKDGNGVSLKGQNAPKIFSEEDKWAPGQTRVVTLQVKNEGDLAFHYDLTLLPGDTAQIATADTSENSMETMMKVAEQFEVYVRDETDAAVTYTMPESIENITKDSSWIKVGSSNATLKDILQEGLPIFSGTMDEAAVKGESVHTYSVALYMKNGASGEGLMGKKLNLNVKLVAYQLIAEQDEIVAVSTAKAFSEALSAGKSVVVTDDIILNSSVEVHGDVVVELQGGDLAATVTDAFQLTEGASLTINASDKQVTVVQNLVYVPDGVNASVTMNGGSYTAATGIANTSTDTALVNVAKRDDTTKAEVNVVLNDVTYTDNGAGWVVLCRGLKNAEGTLNLTVDGCKFTSAHGIQTGRNGKVVMKNTTIVATNGLCMEASADDVLVQNCTLTANEYDGNDSGTFSNVLAASRMGNLVVKDTTLSGNVECALGVLTTGGSITAENCIFGIKKVKVMKPDSEGQTSTMTIDGNLIGTVTSADATIYSELNSENVWTTN